MMAKAGFLLLLITLACTGCRTAEKFVAAPVPVGSGKAPATPEPASSVPLVVPVNVELPIDVPQVAEPIPSGIPATPEPTTATLATMTLWQAVETSLMQNPDLNALRRNEGVSLGMLGVAQTYPFNPFVQFQVTPWQDAKVGGPGTVYHYVLLMQTLQLGGQQRYREDAALATLHSVRWNIVQAELINVAQTERLYFTALYLRSLRDLARYNAEMNEQVRTIIQKQFEGGQAAAADAAMTHVDAQTARYQAQLAEANYQTALLDLRRQMNIPIQAPLELDTDLAGWNWLHASGPHLLGLTCPETLVPSEVEIEQVLDELAARRPDVMAARCDLWAARANAGVARGQRRPDLQIGPYYQRTESGTTYWGFRAQTDIPVVNNGVPLVRQREAEIAQRFAVWQQLNIRACLEAQAAVQRYQRAHTMATGAAASLGEMPRELAQLEALLRQGEVEVVRVVTARNSLIQMRRIYLDTLNELAQSAAAVTQFTALPMEALIGPPSSN